MDHAVSLVQACLQRNGYFTVVEYPIIGTADSQMDALTRSFGKQTGAQLILDPDPDLLSVAYEEQQFRHPSCFCNEFQPVED